MLLHEVTDAGQRFVDLIEGRGVGAADVAFAASAEGAAGDEGDVLGHQELFGKLFRGETGGGDVGEDVKSAFRFETFQAHFAKTVVDEAAAAVVLGDHFVHVFFAVPQRLDGGDLGGNGSAEHGVLVDFGHGSDDLRRAKGVADAPAGHGVGFGETVEKKGALFHPGQSGEADVRFAAIREVAVNFIGDDDEIVRFGEAGDR